MRIFLIYLTKNWPQSGYNYGLGYIASVLKENGHNVKYFTIINEDDINNLYKKTSSDHPDLIGFYVTTSQFTYLKEIVPSIKKIYNSFMVIGGPHPTLQPDCIHEIPELDAIVRGEGEYPLLDLIKAMESKTDYHSIRNFWFQTKDGIIKNDLRPLIEDLDILPFPDKSSLDYQREIDTHNGINRFILTRGCIYECTYCSNKAFTDVYKKSYFRTGSAQKAIEELELDAKKFKFKEIIFDDDTINMNEEWFFEFFNLYKEKFKYPFICNMRPNNIGEDAIKLLKEAGVKAIWIGIEHGNENFRKDILKRNITNKQIIDAVTLIHKYNIKCCAQIMVGLPFENKELFLDTVRLCRQLPIYNKAISIYYPYPSTELGELCVKNNWLPDRKHYNERREATISYPGFTKEEIQMCAHLFPILISFKFIPLAIPLSVLYYTTVFPFKFFYSLLYKIKKKTGYFPEIVSEQSKASTN